MTNSQKLTDWMTTNLHINSSTLYCMKYLKILSTMMFSCKQNKFHKNRRFLYLFLKTRSYHNTNILNGGDFIAAYLLQEKQGRTKHAVRSWFYYDVMLTDAAKTASIYLRSSRCTYFLNISWAIKLSNCTGKGHQHSPLGWHHVQQPEHLNIINTNT